jgi:hypothetical protein
MADYITKDNGTRHTYETGAQKEVQSGKGRYDLLPPEGIKALADLYERGAKKYSDKNWEGGIPISRLMDSMIRHAFQALEGLEDEDHIAAVSWNALAIITIRSRIERGLLPKELDDLKPVGRMSTLGTTTSSGEESCTTEEEHLTKYKETMEKEGERFPLPISPLFEKK